MPSILCLVDDKQVPLYRIMWVSELPHFCGHDDCEREGQYEVRLEHDESLWAAREERDQIIVALEAWQGGMAAEDDWS